jgi:hypothetical protein
MADVLKILGKPLPAAFFGGLVTLAIGLITGWVTNTFFPPKKSVDLGQICQQSGLTGADYAHELGGIPQNAPSHDIIFRHTPGLVVGTGITIQGYDSHDVNVSGVVFDAIRGSWDPSHAEGASGIGYYRTVKVDADTVERAPQFWVPLPKRQGTYVVRVDVWDSGFKFRLATKEGPKFVIGKNGNLKLSQLCTLSS